MPVPSSLVAQLRRRLKDERAGRTAFRFACVDQGATDCILQISRAGMLTTSCMNARQAVNLSLDLINDARFVSVRQLFEYLNSQPGYACTVERDMDADHPASDIQLVGVTSCLNQAVPLRHHIWSDDELAEFTDLAARRHNVGYTGSIVPTPEETFVLMLAQAEAYRDLAGDAAKRNSLDYTAEQCLEMASNLESSYRMDIQRQGRALPVPVPMDEADVGRGEVITTNSYRRSLRTGWMAPIGATLDPTAVILDIMSVEDTKIVLKWSMNRDIEFYAYELWRDTAPGVERPRDVSTMTDVPSVLHDTVKRVYTSKLVMRSAGPHSIRERVGTIAILSEQGGQTITSFVDTGFTSEDPRGLGPATAPPLEPGLTYYYRMFIVGLNDVVTGSNEVYATTLPQRPLFAKSLSLDKTAGPAGTVVTITGTNFPTGMLGKFGDKPVAITVVNTTTATFVVPTFTNPNFVGLRYDIVIQDPNTKLIDVLGNGFMLTAS